MEQMVQRVFQIMNASYNNSADELAFMAEQTHELAEQIVLIFGVEEISRMNDSEVLRLGKLIDAGFSKGFSAGYYHAKKSLDEGRPR